MPPLRGRFDNSLKILVYMPTLFAPEEADRGCSLVGQMEQFCINQCLLRALVQHNPNMGAAGEHTEAIHLH